MIAYGESAAVRHLDENAVVTMAALDGNLEALRVLVALVAQSAYVDGFKAASHTSGVIL